MGVSKLVCVTHSRGIAQLEGRAPLRRLARALSALGAAVMVMVLAMAGPVGAHASLVASSPVAGQVIGGEVHAFDLVFNEGVNEPNVILSGPDGQPLGVEVSQPAPNHVRIVLAEALHIEGDYRLDYQLVSADEDPLSLVLEFAYASDGLQLLPVVATPIQEQDRSLVASAVVAGLVVTVSGLGVRYVLARRRLSELVE